jgi:basic membrane protein A
MPTRRSLQAPLALLAAAAVAAGCGFFSNPGPTGSGLSSGSPPATATPSPTPTPEPRPVASIVLVAAIGEDAPGTRSAVAWQGVQDAGRRLGAEVSLMNPLTRADLAASVSGAAEGGATIVVAVGSEAAPAVLDAAAAHPTTEYFILDRAVADDAPANLHGLVFDEAEAGYLAGVVGAGITDSKKIGFVGDLATDPDTASYADGFVNGAAEIDPSVQAAVTYAGIRDDTQHGRTAAATLIKNGADVVATVPGFSGDGAARAACDRQAQVIALGTDASLVLPDVENCLAVSVLKRYDVAARDAILAFASGDDVPRQTMNDVASGGIALSDFHAPVPPALRDQLNTILAVLQSGPPRPTPSPVPTESPSTSPAA